jgi:YVTN family beta-propeller protein
MVRRALAACARKRMPLWLQRIRACALLENVSKFTTFPLIAVIWTGAPAGAQSARTLLVSNEIGNSISFVDATSGAVKTVPVGNRPRGIAVAPDGRHAYVVLGRDSAIGVVDLARDTVVDKIRCGQDPEQITLSPDGKTAYVTNEETERATAVDLGARAIRWSTVIGGEPDNIGVTPDGQTIYVTTETGNQVAVLRAATGALVTKINIAGRPRFMLVDPNGGRVFVNAENAGTLNIIDTKTNTVVRSAPIVVPGADSAKPAGLALSPDGRTLYMASGRGNRLVVLDLATLRIATTIPVGTRPWGVAISPDGTTLYTADGRSNQVSVIDVHRAAVVKAIAVGERPYTVRCAWVE